MFILITDRLIIRDHKIEDLEAMHKLYSNVEVMSYLQGTKTNSIGETRIKLAEAISEIESIDRRKYFYAIVDKASNQYIGEIGFTIIEKLNNGNVMDLGYFIKKEFWGKGLVTEAAMTLVDYAFKSLNTVKIVAGCDSLNTHSERIMIKIGMKLNKKFKDRVTYSLFRDDYKGDKLIG